MTARESDCLRIAVPAYLRDHTFEGRVILPAVEILEILADFVQRRFPEIPVWIMEEAFFPRFLVLDPAWTTLNARIEWQLLDAGRVKTVLGTVVRSRSGAIGRLAVHGTAVFGGETKTEPIPGMDREADRSDRFAVPAERLYRDLVPFGPAYRNARDPIHVWEEGAEAIVEAPAGGDPRRFLGSPFPLDAALHVACAWCQRYGDTVALPVGFGSRRIVQPIVPGESCRARIAAKGLSEGAFLFDILILGSDERLREELSGVRMRDVSQGRLRPPDWIRVGKQGAVEDSSPGNGNPPA
ncbi:MAG: hypothetical protein CVU61_08895 [Deltaproteobacteria bacterium HGW-Deltaproteobacteria-19]|nr:MAG: hypothetical protein CVU61_08895 [Deltaproteobacteria bacterium HGW-Deltaproteobacteria-19]